MCDLDSSVSMLIFLLKRILAKKKFFIIYRQICITAVIYNAQTIATFFYRLLIVCDYLGSLDEPTILATCSTSTSA